MDLVIKMRAKPGDKHVGKAVIKMYDSTGADTGGQVLLEAETAETGLTLPPGGFCEITEAKRPVIYDSEQKAAMPVDFTPGDPLHTPTHPDVTLPGQQKLHPDDIAAQRKREEAAQKQVEEDRKKQEEAAKQKQQGYDPSKPATGVAGAPPKGEAADQKAMTPPPVKK